MLFGRVLTDGRVNARLKCDLTDNLTLKGNAQVGILVISILYFTAVKKLSHIYQLF